MAILVLTDAKVWMNGYDFSGESNAVALDFSRELKDATTFGHTTKGNKAGLKDIKFNLQGFFNGTIQDPQSFILASGTTSPLIVSPSGGVEGDIAYFFDANYSKYSPGAQVGEMFGFSLEAMNNVGGEFVRGTLVENSTETVSGNSTSIQLGAVATGKKLYACVHVLAVSGTVPTLNIFVASDDNAGFTSGVTQMSFTQITAIGKQIISIAGPITDDYYRLGFTIGGTTPSFTIIGAIGIA